MSQLRTFKLKGPLQFRSINTVKVDEIRMRALDRLYARRDAVDALIRSLEIYEEAHRPLPISAGPMCS